MSVYEYNFDFYLSVNCTAYTVYVVAIVSVLIVEVSVSVVCFSSCTSRALAFLYGNV